MGQATPISSKADRKVSDDEMLAFQHLAWIKSKLGPTNPMVSYLIEMTIEEIRIGPPVINATPQLDLEDERLGVADISD